MYQDSQKRPPLLLKGVVRGWVVVGWNANNTCVRAAAMSGGGGEGGPCHRPSQNLMG